MHITKTHKEQAEPNTDKKTRNTNTVVNELLEYIDNPWALDAQKELAKRELSRRHFFDFVKYTHPDFKLGKFHIELCKKLEEVVYNVKAGKKQLLIIEAPPRHGKTEMVTKNLPAWIFGIMPYAKIMSASYNATKAKDYSKAIQLYISSDLYNNVFPNTKCAESKAGKNKLYKKTATEFDIIGYLESYKCAGVGGSFTGSGGQFLIVDDPVKNAEEAESPVRRQAIYEWFTSSFATRGDAGGFAIIICATRWHYMDLTGMVLRDAEEAKARGDVAPQWNVISFPAIAIEDEEWRNKGEALHPDRFSVQDLSEIKALVNDKVWSALYQQKPTLDGGNFIKWEWFKIINEDVVNKIDFDFTFITADTAQKTKEINDYTVYSAWGFKDNKLYWIDMYRGKIRSKEREDIARIFYKKNFKHPFYGMFIESKSSGTDLAQRLLDGDTERGIDGLIVYEVERSGKKANNMGGNDKVSRASNILAYIEINGVYISTVIKDLLDIKEEIMHFPVAQHDDIVDTLIDAVDIAYKRKPIDFNDVVNRIFGPKDEDAMDTTAKYIKGLR